MFYTGLLKCCGDARGGRHQQRSTSDDDDIRHPLRTGEVGEVLEPVGGRRGEAAVGFTDAERAVLDDLVAYARPLVFRPMLLP